MVATQFRSYARFLYAKTVYCDEVSFTSAYIIERLVLLPDGPRPHQSCLIYAL